MPSTLPLQAGAFGFVLVLFILFLAITIGLIVWTYQDAQTNSSHPALLWALIVFFAPIVGVIIYFLIGRDRV